jgi:hypothetical protein
VRYFLTASVLLASLDERLVEHVVDRTGQGLGPVEHGEDGPADIQAAVAQPIDQVRDQSRVLGRALLDRQRVLGPVDADAQRHDAGVLAEVHPVDHQRDQVEVIEAPGHQFRERGLGRGDEPPRYRRLARGCRLAGHRLPGGLQPSGIAARRQPGQHLLHRQPARDLGRGEQVVAGQVQFPGPSAARTRGRTTGMRRPPRVTDSSSVPCRYPVRPALCLPAGPHSRSPSSPNMAAITCSPVPTAKASRHSFAAPAISAIDTITCSGTATSPPGRSGWARRRSIW